MGRKQNGLSRRYQAALQKYLKPGPRPNSQRAHRLGSRAMALGLETLDLARFHERALITLVLPGFSPGARERMIRRAGTFFAEAITPIEKTHRAAQEEERKMISRELHDQIAQTLTGINIRLATLKAEAMVNVKGLQKKITRTQRMVEKSVDIVHRFARELRPTVLDDLGLIPALHSYMI
jgi:signal transduction histidine kinase